MKKKKVEAKNTDVAGQNETAAETPPVEENQDVQTNDKIEVKINDKKEQNANEEETAVSDNDTDIISQLKEALATAEKEKEALNDRFLRAAADFENQKKRLDKQWVDFKKYANESLARELLTVVDNLERAIAASGDDKAETDKLVEGVKMTLNEILKILERFSVTPIKALGEKFDPNYHQAVSTRQEKDAEDNIVLEEYQKGYMIHDRLLRPAMVVVSAAKQ